ncbi:peptidylprolyl isomerase [uncultured Brevundimonas sp.]|uniref:peptidylprolyl isomerase n=1 Tax=uncultured Brevundimonas sp. TaxID=213418 RepID=UPI0030EF4272|tara:strand:+ start:1307 stop:2173 length:867 start_codon:yes stop_codon:yes gene_type:complete
MNKPFGTLAATAAAVALLTAAGAASAQTPAASDWRTIAPENLLVIDTTKGRVLVELEPRIAPNHITRIRTLADQGFYDGIVFHRVIAGFMAQTGDPTGTGMNGSTLPDLAGEFGFRRGADSGFVAIPNSGDGLRGILGSMPVVTQPDAQMFVTADFKTAASGLFCPAVAGMARSSGADSANSQFFLMMDENDSLNGLYTTFGRVVVGLDVVKALKTGPEATDGRVTDSPDSMTRVRTAAALPEGERPAVRVQSPSSAAFQAEVERVRAARGVRFSICDLQPAAELVGG